MVVLFPRDAIFRTSLRVSGCKYARSPATRVTWSVSKPIPVQPQQSFDLQRERRIKPAHPYSWSPQLTFSATAKDNSADTSAGHSYRGEAINKGSQQPARPIRGIGAVRRTVNG